MENFSFSKEEKTILKAVDKNYTYIARDTQGNLYLCKESIAIEHFDHFITTTNNHDVITFRMFNNIFKEVTFENGPIEFRRGGC